MVEYPINEIFGPTLQGEGLYIGTKTVFIRFAGCDSKCSWCDTKYAWDVSKAKKMSPLDITVEIQNLLQEADLSYLEKPFPSVTLTGGNPLLYDLKKLLPELNTLFEEIHVETQGTKMQDWIRDVDFVVISPKPDSFNPKVIYDIQEALLPEKYMLKVVIFNQQDLNLARLLHQAFPKTDMCLQLGHTEGLLYPGGDYLNLIDQVLIDPHFDDIRILPQLHRILWGDKKGV